MKAIENHLYMMGAIKLRLPLHLSPEMETGQLGPETTRTKTTRTTFPGQLGPIFNVKSDHLGWLKKLKS